MIDEARSDQISVTLTPAVSIIQNIEVDTFLQHGRARQMCREKQNALPWSAAIQKALEAADRKFSSVDISPELVRFLSPAGPFGTHSGRFVVVDAAVSVVLNVEHTMGTPALARLRKIAAASRDVFALGADGSVVFADRLERNDGVSTALVTKAEFQARLKAANATMEIENFGLDSAEQVKNAYDILRISLVDTENKMEAKLRERGLFQSAAVYLFK
ncbi:hypothetical protein [Bradyrhizobium sp. AZCC 1708]|uniref:hypothetical protein n=1 Tax=Bradyrhizobium sp. AZCC 1708 TaxID=3117015 RepID=UPI002FF1D0FB